MRLVARSVASRSVALAILLLSRTALAEPLTREELAQDLFDQARALVAEGDTARACAMFAESQRLDPGAGTYLNLALCHEKEGKLGTAQFELTEALSQARKSARPDREAIATAHLEALAPRVPKLTVIAPGAAVAGLLVELDGVPIAPAAFGLPLPMDVGRHSLRASARGYVPWRWEGTLAEQEELQVAVPQLLNVPEVSIPAVPAVPVQPLSTTRSFSTASYVTFGVSAALLVTSGVTGGVALSQKAVYETECVPSRHYCKGGGADALSSSRTFAWVSTGALALGVGSAITAFFLPRSVRVVPAVEPNSAGLAAFGSF